MEDTQANLVRWFLRLGWREVGGREVVDEDNVALAPVVAVDGLRRRRDKVVDEAAEVGDGGGRLVGVGRALGPPPRHTLPYVFPSVTLGAPVRGCAKSSGWRMASSLLLHRSHSRSHSGRAARMCRAGASGRKSVGAAPRGTRSMCITAAQNGVAYEVPSTCQPVVPTPWKPSSGAFDMRRMRVGCGERSCW